MHLTSSSVALHRYVYPSMRKTLMDRKGEKVAFELEIEGGSFKQSQIIVMLGENGTGEGTRWLLIL